MEDTLPHTLQQQYLRVTFPLILQCILDTLAPVMALVMAPVMAPVMGVDMAPVMGVDMALAMGVV